MKPINLYNFILTDTPQKLRNEGRGRQVQLVLIAIGGDCYWGTDSADQPARIAPGASETIPTDGSCDIYVSGSGEVGVRVYG